MPLQYPVVDVHVPEAAFWCESGGVCVIRCFGQPAESDVEGAMLSSYTDEENELVRSINGKLKAMCFA